ncbi:MAG: hypothetical protein EBR67_00820 [Proteobacteria bacterium]|nr:hypothetical protein [Pseudomonadota bacterium]
MNKSNAISPFNLNYPATTGPSGPSSTIAYSQVYENLPEIGGSNFKVFDIGLIKDIKNALTKRKSSGTEAVDISGAWTQLSAKQTNKITIFNNTDWDIEIKQLDLAPIIPYNHSQFLQSEERVSTFGDVSNLNLGNFTSQTDSNNALTNAPYINNHCLAYAKLPENFDVKKWSIEFEGLTSPISEWSGWDPARTLGARFVVTMFNNWVTFPNSRGLRHFEGDFNTLAYSAGMTNEPYNEGYYITIEDQKDLNSEVKDTLYNLPVITGINHVTGTSSSCTIQLLTSGLESSKNIGTTGSFFFNNRAYPISLNSNLNSVTLTGACITAQPASNFYTNVPASLQVRRAWPASPPNQGLTTGNLTTNFNVFRTLASGYSVTNITSWKSTLGPFNRMPNAVGPVALSWGGTGPGNLTPNNLYSSTTELQNIPSHLEYRTYKIEQADGTFRFFIKNTSGQFLQLGKYYDRFYYSRANLGKYIGFGAAVNINERAYHSIRNVFLNDQKISIYNSPVASGDINKAPSITLPSNSAIDLDGLINTNQIFLKRKDGGNGSLNLKYRWEN